MAHACSITDNGITSFWLVEDLWKAAEGLPVEECPVETLIPLLKKITWSQTEIPSAWDCLFHTKRILDADLSFPIILDPKGRILDGSHRLAKASLNNMATITVVRLMNMPPSNYTEKI